jgi:hypothetical protein
MTDDIENLERDQIAPRAFREIPLTAPEKAFWKDAFLACARSTLSHHNVSRPAPEVASAVCADFADAAMAAYRSRIIWRKP